jgi:DAK2 domain fusion protein YloV
MAKERLSARDLRAVVDAFRTALQSHRDAINRLNVYPVPDGDTGTNMALTIESVAQELASVEEAGDGDDRAAVCRAIAHGSLMGARGNSGVILSQILRGLSDVLREPDHDDAGAVAAALGAASKAAYGAVMRPVEGTILTVVRAAAEAAEDEASRTESLVAVVEAARAGAADALARTPELLDVLAVAGVVDAGGTGLVLLFDAMLHVIDGRPLPDPPAGRGGPVAVAQGREANGARAGEGDVGDLRYEVMYFLEAPDGAIPAFKDVWAGIGDSIVVVGGDGIWNCHIHTDDIGAAIEAAIDCGRPRSIRVTDLVEQMEEERWVREGVAAGGGLETPPHVDLPVPTAVVAVATGEGVRRIFYSLGVQQIVAGGQSMNPSTAQLLAAVEAAPAQQVVILPNNKNIVPVAEQVDDLTAKSVRVVPTRGVAEGFAALMAYDPEASVDSNADGMAAAAEHVLAGEVTRAVRDSTCDIGPIAAGDWLGVAGDGIRAIDATVAGACTALLDALLEGSHEIVTVIEGEGSSAADTRRITEWLADVHPDVTAEVHHGGQPLYAYLVGIE